MVRKNFEKDIYYIGSGNKYLYWNIFPDEEKYSKILYYLSTEGKVPTSFKNLYYDFSYNKNDDEQYEDQFQSKSKNSLKNMDLDSEKQVISDFHSCSRRNVRETPTREFFGLRHSLRDNSSTESLRFESSTGNRTYETAFAAARQSHSTVRTQNCPNTNIYFCEMCTVDIIGTVTNSHDCSIFCMCPCCALGFMDSGKRIFRRPHPMKLYESGIDSRRTIWPQRSFGTKSGVEDKGPVIFDKYKKN